ncbi:M4 family metallopeptidase [Leeuwenhoekiella sp. UBA1003]|uniref:M4 family metallopeptidase n=1 Tax=Leeuwenhoekiella sp. UBA1003 TaxID=1946744 RepID=UPI0025C164A2|nr:M4 family metallopeptidase [Leeuwenhoekiella sp. UBA1003]
MQSKSMTGPRIILGSQLELTDDNTFTQVDLISEKSGMQHQRFDQYYDNVRVEFSSPVIHSEKGTPTAISGEFYAVKDLSTTPAISPQQGFQNALRQIGAQHYLWEYPDAAQEIDYQKPAGELVVLPYITDAGTTMKLAYKYDIYATFPLSRGEVYVDAQKGDVLFYNSIIKHVDSFGHVGEIAATVRTADEAKKALEDYDALAYVTGSAATRYSGTRSIETTLSGGSYILADAGRKLYTRDAKNQAPGSTYPYINNYDQFTDNDNNWTSAEHSANKDDAALDAHWGAMMTYDYFLSQHNRNSFDNNGTQIRSYVHVDVNYDNAFWNGSVMSYGDGSSNGQEGNGYFDALTSLDVAAHEIGHAVCTYTANLAYQRESGGLNEGFSDIWGAAVEFYAKGNGNETNPNPEIWLIGDEIDRRTGSAALRSMSDPKSLGQPDTYGGTYWKNPNCGTPTRTNDYCGVHTNSGVLNHWFYLSSVGGTGTNDVGSSYSVNGIGVTKAARISYRTESLYLSSNSTYADARAASIQAAIDLYGAGSAEEQAVTNAWYAVNVGSAYGETPPVDYCTSQGNSVADEYIGRVQLGSIDNASGATSGYTDHTAVSTELTRGSSATITITPVWRGTVYSEGYAVWIDYNQNGSFTDSGELVFSQGANQNTSVSGSFTVPTSALDGSTRMRVSMKYNGIPSSCETFSYGEVEDYTITFGGGTADTEAPSAPTNLAASNVTETTLDLTWTASTDNVGVTGYDVYQGASLLGTVTGTSASITGLTADTSYSFSVQAKDAAGNVSASSNVVNVTTAGGTTPDTEAPSAPTNLTASNVTETTLDLTWTASTDNVGVTGYDVYQGASLLGSVTGTSASITGLTANTAYTFTVNAKDAAGNSSAGASVNVTTADGGGGPIDDTLIASYFETGWDGWIDGGGDCARYAGSRSPEGSYSIQLRDNSGVASSMTSPVFDLSAYDNVEISFSMYAYSMENGEDFWVRYNDGSGWQTVVAYARGTSFNNNTFYTATVNLPASSYNLSSTGQFRFQCDASANGDLVYIDEVVIRGTATAGVNAIVEAAAPQTFRGESFAEQPDFEGDFVVYPSPAVDLARVQVMLDIEDKPVDVVLSVYDIKGSRILTKEYSNVTEAAFTEELDVTSFKSGVYFVEITAQGGMKETAKFIKK